MIDWLIIYGILMGALRLLLNHHQPVESGGTSPYTAKGLLGLWVRLMLIAFIIIQGFHLYWLWSYAYNRWWDAYWVEHSPMAFVLVTLPATLALYVLKEITYHIARDPHGFQMYAPGTGQPTLIWTSMKTPTVWFVAYWAWILFSPCDDTSQQQ